MSSKNQPNIGRKPRKKLYIPCNTFFKKYHKEFSFHDVDVILAESISISKKSDSLNIFLYSENVVQKNEQRLQTKFQLNLYKEKIFFVIFF